MICNEFWTLFFSLNTTLSLNLLVVWLNHLLRLRNFLIPTINIRNTELVCDDIRVPNWKNKVNETTCRVVILCNQFNFEQLKMIRPIVQQAVCFYLIWLCAAGDFFLFMFFRSFFLRGNVRMTIKQVLRRNVHSIQSHMYKAMLIRPALIVVICEIPSAVVSLQISKRSKNHRSCHLWI